MSVKFASHWKTRTGLDIKVEQARSKSGKPVHITVDGLDVPDLALSYDVSKLHDQPGRYAEYARFADEAAFQYHQKTPFHERLVPPIVECLEGGAAGMDLAFYDWVG